MTNNILKEFISRNVYYTQRIETNVLESQKSNTSIQTNIKRVKTVYGFGCISSEKVLPILLYTYV